MHIYFFLFTFLFGKKEKDFIDLYQNYLKNPRKNWHELYNYYLDNNHQIEALKLYYDLYKLDPKIVANRDLTLNTCYLLHIPPFKTQKFNMSDSFVQGAILSPGNKYLCYYKATSQTNTDIYLMNLQDSTKKVITTDTLLNTHPIFDHNGENLYFITQINKYYSILEKYNIQNDIKEKVIDKENMYILHPSISPDNKYIAFQAKDGKNKDWDIYIYNRETGEIKQITDNIVADISPVFSSDGKYLYFSSNTSGDFDIYKYNIKNKKTKVFLKIKGSNEWGFDIAPDNEYLIFSSDLGTRQAGIFYYSIKNNKYWQIDLKDRVAYFSISPDSKYVLYTVILQPYGTELRYLNIDEATPLETIIFHLEREFEIFKKES